LAVADPPIQTFWHKKLLADGGNKSFLLLCTKLIFVWLHGIKLFQLNRWFCGYHEYKVAWYNPLVGEDLLSEHEVGNPHDTHAV